MKQTKKWNLHFTRKKPPLIKMNTKCVVDTAEVYYTPKKFLWWFFLQKNHQTQGSKIFKLPRGRIPQKDRQTTHYKICQNINYWALKCSDKNVNEVSCMVHEFVLHNSSETTPKKTSLQNLELFCFF